MMNSADCRSKTPPVPTRTPWREKSSRHKGLMRGHSPRHPRPSQISRNMTKLGLPMRQEGCANVLG